MIIETVTAVAIRPLYPIITKILLYMQLYIVVVIKTMSVT